MAEVQEKIIVISDIEMGRGDIMDDFYDDEILASFIDQQTDKHADIPMTLVCNGDTFDFLKMSYKGKYPRSISLEVSMWKLEEVLKTHTQVFEALKRLLEHKKHSIFFVIGNHDADLAWPEVQNRLKEFLGSRNKVSFDYEFGRPYVHIEHGQQFDPFFQINTEKNFFQRKGKTYLKTSFGAQVCFQYLNPLKKKYPEAEQVYPKKMIPELFPAIKREKKKTLWKIIFKDMIIKSLMAVKDPTYTVPWKNISKHLWRHGFDFLNDKKFLPHLLKSAQSLHEDKNIIVLGHLHVFHTSKKSGIMRYVTDTWRNEIDVTDGEKTKPKSFVEINMFDDGGVKADLKVYGS